MIVDIITIIKSICSFIVTISPTITAITATISIVITWKIFKKNIEIASTNKIDDRYFTYVTLHALDLIDNSKENIRQKALELVENVKKSSDTNDTRQKVDEVLSIFYDFKSKIAPRLTIFDLMGTDTGSFFDNVENQITEIGGNIVKIGRDDEETTINNLVNVFDQLLIAIKNKNFKNV